MEKYVGKNIVKPDGYNKVTGRAKYAADMNMDGQLYVAVVHSKKAHAKILSIDTTEAEKQAYVFTYKDLANNEIVDIINDRPVLAQDKVRFMGEAVAVVAAETIEKARLAAEEVKICYEELPVYVSAKDAMVEGAEPIAPNGNIASTFENEKGNVERGFSEADLIIEREYFVPHQEHAYIEPDASFSYYDGDVLVLYTASQSAFNDQRMASHALGIPMDGIRVISATVGGGFGGKDGHTTQLFSALVTYKTKRPAKTVFTRQESIAYTFKRHSANMKVKMGFKKDGTITAFSAKNVIDTGAYIGYGFTVLGLLSEHIAGPYVIPNVKINSKLVYTNTTTSSAYRGFGAPQGAFATESLINEAAEKLGISQIDIRLKNALTTGAVGTLGQDITASCGLKEALTMLNDSQFLNGEKEEGVGYGVAAGHLSCGFGKGIPDSAEVQLKEVGDGFELYVGFTEIGNGSTASLSMIAADALGVDTKKVKLIQSDTKFTFDCGCTAASRSTFVGGNAIIKAVEEYKKRKAQGEKDIVVKTKADFPEPEMKMGIGMPHAMYTYVVQAIKVKVCPITGKVDILDAMGITEAGRIINPMQMSGQVAGGMLQSIGYATTENITFGNDGKLINDSFSTYIVPTFMDAPKFNTMHVDGYEPSGPYGAKGAAESPTVPTAAAVNSAIQNATGVWHYSLPITPESVLLGGKN